MLNPTKRILFICGKAKQRSPTAEHVFASYDNIETDAAGLSNDADIVLSSEQLDWATDIDVMEKSQLRRLRTKYSKHLNGRKLICLDIADKYAYMQLELVALLEQKKKRFL